TLANAEAAVVMGVSFSKELKEEPGEAADDSRFMAMSLSAKAPMTIDDLRQPKTELERFTEMLDMVDDMTANTEMVVRRLENLASILKHKKGLLRNIPSLMPVAEGYVSSEYGMRLSPFEGKRHVHAGIDI